MKVVLPLASLIEVVFSSPGVVPYNLLAFNDVMESGVVDGLAYSNTPLNSCAVVQIGIVQIGSEPVQDSVQAPF